MPDYQILHSHRVDTGPEWSWDSHLNRWTGYHLWFIAAGFGSVRAPSGTLAIAPGACFLLRMDEPYYARQDPARPLTVLAAHFETAETELPPVLTRVQDIRFFTLLLDRLIAAHQAGDQATAGAWLHAALLELRHWNAVTAPAFQCSHATAIAALAAELAAHPERRLSVPELARRLGCAPDTFIRLYRRQLGITPGEAMIRNRIDAARNLLIFSRDPIGTIAERLGYPDANAFCRQFRHYTRQSPLRYRRTGAK